MNMRRLLTVLATVTVAAAAFAQTPPARPPLPPGWKPPDLPPAQEKAKKAQKPPMTYEEWAKDYFAVKKAPKKYAIFLPNHRVQLHPILPTVYELVGEEGDYILVRNLPPEDPQSPVHELWLRGELNQIRGLAIKDYLADKYLVNDEVVPDLPFTDRLDFTRMDQGLPHEGRWQVSFDVADMNGDGRLDLVLPGPRGDKRPPLIVLQGADGAWQAWKTTWPTKDVSYDYGTVRVADFDGDGHPDVALACHFGSAYVFYGNGKGDFSRFVRLPKAGASVTSRSLAVGDFNGDGRPDLATLAELDVDMATSESIANGLVAVLLNMPGGWRVVTSDKFPQGIMGDRLSTADLDGDGATDLVLTSTSQNVMDLFYRNVRGDGTVWESIAPTSVPVNAFVFSATPASIDMPPGRDVVLCFEQFNPIKVEPPSQACTLYHFHDAKGHPALPPRRELLLKRKVEFKNYRVAAVGDVDGDGRQDIVLGTNDGRIEVLLQLSPDSFFVEQGNDLDTGGSELFDLRVADLDGDGLGEIIAIGAPAKESKGGVWVFHPHPRDAKSKRQR